ncbi:MAG TPA: abortive infection family protein [Thermoanaerobaculia bacterium]|nr:abortive infection family protein [Thermoanaerobaculia bacterium]
MDDILDEIEHLEPSCKSSELRVRELQTAVHSFSTRLEQLHRDEPAFRIFDRMRNEPPTWWRDHGEYVDKEDFEHLRKWRKIAETILDRVDPSQNSRKQRGFTTTVATPQPTLSTAVVDRAISDAETLIRAQGATSAVDRIHTALHGYLRVICDAAKITTSTDASLTQLFKAIREHHPKFQATGARAADIQQIVRAIASIVGVLDPVRNQATVVHPNLILLDEPEAMLVINAARTILHYLDAKLR